PWKLSKLNSHSASSNTMPLMTNANSPKVIHVSGKPTTRRIGATTALTMTNTAASIKNAVNSLPCVAVSSIPGMNYTTTHKPASMTITVKTKFHKALIEGEYK